MSLEKADSLSRLALGSILVIAAVPRLAGLGHVSLWLDEILGTLMVAPELPAAWQAWQGNAVHPPLSELMSWAWFRLVEPEPLRRLLPIAFGVLTVGLLARLAGRGFGRRAAWATALIAALSPLHVRYSQELRPYALGLLALTLALVANERALERSGWRRWVVLALALALCYWSLYLTAIVLLPIAVTTLETAARRSTWRRELAGFAVALVLSAVLFSPWLPVLERGFARGHELQATALDLPLLGSRWQFLTVGGVEGTAPSAGALLFAALVAAGMVAAAGSSRGRSMIAGAAAGTFGVELLLQLSNHWSNGRYNLVSWPFLAILAGLGCGAIFELFMRLWRAVGGARGKVGRLLGPALATLPLVALLIFEAGGLAEYYRRGRPDWQSVARAVSAMAAPDRQILVSNDWTRLSLGYYLARLESPRAEVSTRPRIVDSSTQPAELVDADCTVLVDAGWSRPKAIDEALLATPAQRDFPRSGARVAVGAPAAGAISAGSAGDPANPWRCLPLEIEQAAGERPAPRFLEVFARFRRGDPWPLEFTAGDQPHLRYGWSYSEQAPGGSSFRWAVGHWAAIDLPARRAGTLRLVAWSLFDDQLLSVIRDRQLLATLPLNTAKQTLRVALPGDFGTAGSEILVFGFSRYAGPQENPRPLAAAFDRVELLP